MNMNTNTTIIHTGILDLSPNFKTADYIIQSNSNTFNISEQFDRLLLSDVNVKITAINRDSDILYNRKGKLRKNKLHTTGHSYGYFIDYNCLDNFLWKNVGRSIQLEIDIL